MDSLILNELLLMVLCNEKTLDDLLMSICKSRTYRIALKWPAPSFLSEANQWNLTKNDDHPSMKRNVFSTLQNICIILCVLVKSNGNVRIDNVLNSHNELLALAINCTANCDVFVAKSNRCRKGMLTIMHKHMRLRMNAVHIHAGIHT